MRSTQPLNRLDSTTVKSERRFALFPKSRSSRREAFYGYLFISPQVLGFFLFVLGPVLAVFAFSLQSRSLLSGKATSIGLRNYQQLLLSDPTFIKVLVNSLRFTAGLLPLNIGLSLILALLLSRKMPGVRPFRTLFFAPVVTSGIAWAIVWQFVLQGKQGVLNQLLGMIGIEGPNWLFHPEWAMISVIVTRVIKNVGVNMVIFLAAIQDVPEEQIDAASVDGANTWETIRHIIIPYLAPTVFMATIITVIGSLKVFDHIMALTAGGPANATLVLVFYVYHHAFRTFELGYSSALAVVLFLIALGLTVLQWSLRRRISYAEQ